MMKNADYDMLYLLRCIVNKKIPDENQLLESNRNRILKVARFHSLTAMIVTALEQAGETLEKSWVSEKEKAVRKSILLEAEYHRIASYMEEQGIWYMLLKGSVLQKLYGKKGMRQMADVDILFDERYREQLQWFMRQSGYEVKSFGQGNHDAYLKPPVYNFELHVSLYGSGHEKIFQEYYRSVKERLLPVKGKYYEFCFTKEDFYIYHISHMYKHYAGGGTGIRSLVDCYLFLQEYGSGLDWKYIETELRKLKLERFEKQSRQLCIKVFGGEEDLTEQDEQILEEYLCAGTYGTMERRIEQQIELLKKGKGIRGAKIVYMVQRLFPKRELLEVYCPSLQRHACLLPYAWGKRIVQSLYLRGERIFAEIKCLNKAGREE